jgi:FAD/FMN-containing dehydrogenase
VVKTLPAARSFDRHLEDVREPADLTRFATIERDSLDRESRAGSFLIETTTRDLTSYLQDASGFTGHAEALVRPRSEAEIVEIVRRAAEHNVPITVSGAGTGLTGGRVAQGGWIVSLERFQHLQIEPGKATAGAAVPLATLQAAAAPSRQFFGPDPTEWLASVGGSIANNASGSRSFRYGDTRRHVERLRVVVMDGSVLDVRRGDTVDFEVPRLPVPATTKYTGGYRLSPGMDWIDLFTGSEGTLGIVVEADLTLLPTPAALLSGVAFFPEDGLALEAVDDWRPVAGLRMLEYMDRGSLNLLRPRYSDIPVNAGAALLIEQELESEDSHEIDAWLERIEASQALEDSWFGLEARDRERFRAFRHALPEQVNETVRRNGFLKIGSDYAVPIVRNREILSIYRSRLEQEYPGAYVIFGHIGDAHVHVNLLPTTQQQFDRGQQMMVEFAREVVRLGGTVSAEHGLGKRKAHLLAIQYTPEQIEAMKQVKRRLDPQWLLGRGNIFGE